MLVIATIDRHDACMELQQLRYVLAVEEERSFTRAATRCHVVQSALSHQIKALEREIGVQLFARSSRRVELTAAGAAFLPEARASVAAADRARAEAAAATGELRGTLAIGLIPTVTAVDIPDLLGTFRQAHPAVSVSLRVGASDEMVAAVGAGSLDVAFLGLAEGAPVTGVSSRELARHRLVAVVGADHLLGQRRRLRLADLSHHPFVDFPAGSPGRAQSDRAFERAGLTREVPYEVTSTDLALGLVRAGLAIALLAPQVVPEQQGVRSIPVQGGPTRVEHLAWSGFNPSPAATAFVDLVRPRRE